MDGFLPPNLILASQIFHLKVGDEIVIHFVNDSGDTKEKAIVFGKKERAILTNSGLEITPDSNLKLEITGVHFAEFDSTDKAKEQYSLGNYAPKVKMMVNFESEPE